MLAIPNMDKPKSCSKCRWWDTCSVLYGYFDGSVYEYSYEDILDSELDEKCHSDCPLIEIVRCGECKWWNRDGKRKDGKGWCENVICGLTKPNAFCSYGERRADEDI